MDPDFIPFLNLAAIPGQGRADEQAVSSEESERSPMEAQLLHTLQQACHEAGTSKLRSDIWNTE